MKHTFLICCALFAVCTSSLRAQTALERDPGYVDIDAFASWFDTSPTVEVNIKGSLLRMAAAATRDEDPVLAAMLTKLRAIQVRTFRYRPGLHNQLLSRTDGLSRRLREQGWDAIVRVRDDGENVDMFMRASGEKVQGMMVTVVSPDEEEVVFINIVGEIDPEEVGRLGSRFDIKGLDRTAHRR